MNRKITIAILLSITVLLIAWDVWVYLEPSGEKNDTISEVTLGFAMKHPVLPFAIGVLCGHLLWPQKVSK